LVDRRLHGGPEGRHDGEYPACYTVWGDLMHQLKAYAEGHPRGPHFT
jgi:hypothetical protein